MMRTFQLFLLISLVPAAYGDTIVNTFTTAQVPGGPLDTDSCTGTTSCSSFASSSQGFVSATVMATATAGLSPQGYFVRVDVSSFSIYASGSASATLDEMLTFSGNLVFGVTSCVGGFFCSPNASVHIDAPRFTGDLTGQVPPGLLG